MRELGYEEFTNQHGDQVTALLAGDSAGGYHLIVKCKRHRRSEETRMLNDRIITLPVSTFTDETSHTNIAHERTAMVEFKMACMMHNMPGFGMEEFQAWQKATEQEVGA